MFTKRDHADVWGFKVGCGRVKMRNFYQNLSAVYFRLYVGQEEMVDEYGNATGSFSPKYGPLQSARLCVSPNKGSSETEMFGSLEDYDRTMTTADTSCLIDENSIIWLDGKSTDGPHNYIVKKRAPWKNSVAYAIKRVSVSE